MFPLTRGSVQRSQVLGMIALSLNLWIQGETRKGTQGAPVLLVKRTGLNEKKNSRRD